MSANIAEILRQCVIAIAAVAVVFAVTMLLTAFVQTEVSTIYLVAVMYSAWRGGLGAGLVATFLSVVIAAYFFLSPIYTFSIQEGLIELIVFALAAVLVSSLAAERERALGLEHTARLEAERANRVKDEFLATVSHELRTPLTTIKTLTRLLLRQDPPANKRREYLETISVECDRQIDLVLNLLDTSRIEGGVFRLSIEKIDVEEVIRSCVKAETSAAERRQHKLAIEPSGAVPPISADPKALRRVLSNLIENAIKYTPDGGRISLFARNEGEFVSIGVKDNGRGIPKEDLPVLFDKFHRGKPAPHSEAMRNATEDAMLLEDADVSGIGLGLYLAKNVMERMGGEILVDTEVGSGSTFTLRLPVWKNADRGSESQLEGNDVEASVGR
jgi:signal transduction histidine kinase